MCWYEPDEWLKVKKMTVDAEAQDDRYDEWRANPSQAIRDFRDAGKAVAKVSIKAKEFF